MLVFECRISHEKARNGQARMYVVKRNKHYRKIVQEEEQGGGETFSILLVGSKEANARLEKTLPSRENEAPVAPAIFLTKINNILFVD